MNAMASQITSLTGVYSTVYSGADQRKHQISASLAFVRGIPLTEGLQCEALLFHLLLVWRTVKRTVDLLGIWDPSALVWRHFNDIVSHCKSKTVKIPSYLHDGIQHWKDGTSYLNDPRFNARGYFKLITVWSSRNWYNAFEISHS